MKCKDEMHNHNINNEGYCAMCSEEEYPLSTFSPETQKELIAWKDEEVRKAIEEFKEIIEGFLEYKK